METIIKVGEITCNSGEFVKWVEENLENTDFIVRLRITNGFDPVFEIYKKIE